jgi:hypothetical protein
MAKRKKTLKQKLLSDSRRKTVLIDTPELSEKEVSTIHKENKYSLNQASLSTFSSSENHKSQPAIKKNISTVSYEYLRTDLQKTVALTIFILIAELLIKFFVKGI